MPAQPTKSGTRRLSELARHVIPPQGIESTAWPAVRAKCLELGVRFDSWQDGLGRAILAKRADGKYAAGVGGVVISIPRQVGKTYTVGAIVFALCALHPGLTVIWTAHRLKTAGETFRSMQAMARRQKIKPFIEQVFTGSGDEEVRFVNGSRILFGARERGFGRGFAEVDVEVFDEAQILTDRALDDMIPATNQAKHPAGALLFFIGTPPKPTDPGEAFTSKREKALAGAAPDTLYVEFSADRGANPDDRTQWAKANASYPLRTPAEAMLRMRENLTAEAFLREGLGVWDEVDTKGALPHKAWLDLADPDAPRGARVAFGLDVAEDRAAWVAVAWARDDGSSQVMLTDPDASPAYSAAERCAELTRQWGGQVVPPRSFEADIEKAGAGILPMKQGEFAAACGAFADAVTEGKIRHGNQPALNAAVKAARWRTAGSTGERAFQLKDSPEVGPLAAAVRALHGLSKPLDVALNVW